MNDEVTNKRISHLDWLSNIPLDDYTGGAYPDLSPNENFRLEPDVKEKINIGVVIIKIAVTFLLLSFIIIAIAGGIKYSTDDTLSNIITGCLVGTLSFRLFELIILIWQEG